MNLRHPQALMLAVALQNAASPYLTPETAQQTYDGHLLAAGMLDAQRILLARGVTDLQAMKLPFELFEGIAVAMHEAVEQAVTKHMSHCSN